MAEIRRLLVWRHLRAECTSFVVCYRSGRLARCGRGLAFWFLPYHTSVAELPCDDRDLPFLFHGRTSDFQDVVTQGGITYRLAEPLKVAERVDFTVDLRTGGYLQTPLDKVAQMLTRLAQELAMGHVSQTPVRDLLRSGVEPIRERLQKGLAADQGLTDLGLEVVAVRVAEVAPTAELEKALQTPTREAIQQRADEATFERRALAVDKERAIAENELANRIELARREEALIRQKGQNGRAEAAEQAEAEAVNARAEAERRRLEFETEADGIRAVELARVGAERDKIDVYRDLPPPVLLGLAARDLAGKLQSIEHVSITPEVVGPFFTRLLDAGARYLDVRTGEAG